MNKTMALRHYQNQLSTQSAFSSCQNYAERLMVLKYLTKVSDMFLQDRGYEVGQRNGQRISVLSGYQLPNDDICREVFVGKLPRDMLELELLPAMQRVGPVYKIRLMMDFSGFNRGYGFVVFINPADATRACQMLDNTSLRPNSEFRIGVCPSFNNKNLKVANLPSNVPKETLIIELKKVVDGIESVSWPDYQSDRGLRSALVKFKTHEDATMARRVLCPGNPRIMNQRIQVDWAKPDAPIMCPSVVTSQHSPEIPPHTY